MRRLAIAAALLSVSCCAYADFPEVAQRIESMQRDSAGLNASRESEFSATVAGTRAATNAAIAKDRKLQERISELENAIAGQDARLVVLDSAIRDAALSTTTLSAAVRQAGSELAARIRRSPVSAEHPGRAIALDTLATSPGLPPIPVLEDAWLALADELQRSAELSVFSADGIDEPITRVGALALITNSDYLSWSGETVNRIASNPGMAGVVLVDPTRDHALFRQLGLRTPAAVLIKKAGPVGLVIIALALAAVPIFVLRTVLILRARAGVGIADVNRGRLALRLIATATPLLGLLGTIAGMITAFRGLNLFGQGDPALIADSIGQALLTTALGLIVAVPVFFLAVVLERLQAGIEHDFETEGHVL